MVASPGSTVVNPPLTFISSLRRGYWRPDIYPANPHRQAQDMMRTHDTQYTPAVSAFSTLRCLHAYSPIPPRLSTITSVPPFLLPRHSNEPLSSIYGTLDQPFIESWRRLFYYNLYIRFIPIIFPSSRLSFRRKCSTWTLNDTYQEHLILEH